MMWNLLNVQKKLPRLIGIHIKKTVDLDVFFHCQKSLDGQTVPMRAEWLEMKIFPGKKT